MELDDKGLTTGIANADGAIRSGLGGAINWAKLGIAGAIAGVVAGVGTAVKKGLDSFVSFEEKMNQVYTLLPDLSDQAMMEMEGKVKDLSKQLGVIPDELIPALYSSISASVPEENVFDFLDTAIKASLAGVTQTETVVDGLTTVLNSYHMEADQAEYISDVLFQTIKYGKTSMEELSGSMSNVTPIASALGVNFEDIGAALATMTAQGASTATTSTQLKAMFNELSKEGSQANEIFREIAGKSFVDFIAEGHNVNDALNLMHGHAQDTNVGINNLFGGIQAGQAALMLTGESAEMFARNIENMGDAAGATEQAYQTMDAGLGRSMEKIKNSLGIMLLGLGEKFAPAVSNLADYILEVMPIVEAVVGNTFDGIGQVIQVFINIINFVVGLIQDSISDSEGEFNSLFEIISEVFTSIGEFISSVVEFLTDLWDKYGENIIAITSTVFGFITNVIQTAFTIIKGIFDFFTGLFTGDWEKMGEALSTITSAIWDLIKNIFETALNLIFDILELAGKLIIDIGKGLMTGLWEGIKYVWGLITNWYREKIDETLEIFGNQYDNFKNIGRNLFSYLWDGIKGIWSSISSWISDKVDWIADKLAFWRKSNDEMVTDGGGGGVRAYQTGTPYVPTTGLALLHKGEAVIPAMFNPFAGGAGLAGVTNQTVTVNPKITINVKDVVDLKRKQKEITKIVMGGISNGLERMGVK